MTYDQEFFRLYRDYLREPVVRENHARAFECFRALAGGRELTVLDFGCGLGEYRRFGSYSRYVGVDREDTGGVSGLIQADYTTLDFLPRLPCTPNAFVSLFSVECCMPPEARYALYEKIFAALPGLDVGMAGGFFYERRRELPKVSEAGGLVSYQSIEDPLAHLSPTFLELRLAMRTPSALFGDDVVEVWKFFKRRA